MAREVTRSPRVGQKSTLIKPAQWAQSSCGLVGFPLFCGHKYSARVERDLRDHPDSFQDKKMEDMQGGG